MNILSKNNILIVLVFVAVVFVSGCIQGFDATSIAKSSEAVKAFLAEYPNAKVVASIVNNANIRGECENSDIPIKNYWKVSLQDPDSDISVNAWIDADTQQAVCVIKIGGKEKEKPQENKTDEKGPDDIKENKTDDINKKDINKTESNKPTNTISPEISLCDNSCIGISYFHFNSQGNDNDNLNDEYLTLKSTCQQSCDLSGWTLKDIANHLYNFPSFVFEKDSTVTLYTGSGSNTKTDLYWGSRSAIWNNDGDTLYLWNLKNELVLDYSYTGS